MNGFDIGMPVTGTREWCDDGGNASQRSLGESAFGFAVPAIVKQFTKAALLVVVLEPLSLLRSPVDLTPMCNRSFLTGNTPVAGRKI